MANGGAKKPHRARVRFHIFHFPSLTIPVMHLISTAGRQRRSTFAVLHSTAAAQAAMMTLRPGQSSSDDPVNEHPRCEQWLFVISGTGRATAGKRARRVALKPNALLVIEQGEPHQI